MGRPQVPLSKSIAYPATETGDTDHPTDHPPSRGAWSAQQVSRVLERIARLDASAASSRKT